MSELSLGRLTMRGWGLVNAVLACLVLLVVAALVVVLVGGAKVLPWTTPASRQAAAYDQVQAATTKVMQAFLNVDYHDMGKDIAAVKSLSTGAFLKQYSASALTLKSAAEEAQSVSTGTVAHVGVTSVTATTATTMVAADVVVMNSSTKGRKASAACPHAGAQCDTYRFAVTLTDTPDGWKMSNLVGVS